MCIWVQVTINVETMAARLKLSILAVLCLVIGFGSCQRGGGYGGNNNGGLNWQGQNGGNINLDISKLAVETSKKRRKKGKSLDDY